jgi:integrase
VSTARWYLLRPLRDRRRSGSRERREQGLRRGSCNYGCISPFRGSRYSKTSSQPLLELYDPSQLASLIREFTLRYANASTARQYEAELSDLFHHAGVDHPRQLTESAILAWCGSFRANNTVRNRLSRACTFLRWCVRQGHADPAVVEALMSRDNPLRQIPRLYGKVQAIRPARWLSQSEAFEQLVGACRDGTDLGLRDEVLIRLGLAGMRSAEIIHLRIGDVRLDGDEPRIEWIGKKRRARRVVPGASLVAALGSLQTRREELLCRPLLPTDPVICCGKSGFGSGQLAADRPVRETVSVQQIVAKRAELAGLGHVAPHDLRRTAAGLLHRSVGEDGSHHFDLLDIQKVLGHSDPATTMRSYLDPLDIGVLSRAARVLD